MDSSALSYDCTFADSPSSPSQSIPEDGQKDDRCNDTLESKEILDLGHVSRYMKAEQTYTIHLCIRYT